MKVLVLGAGMYVTGRGGVGAGTVLASLAEASRDLPIEEVVVAARNPQNEVWLSEALIRVNGLLGTALRARFERIHGANLRDEVTELCKFVHFNCAIVVTPDHLHFDPVCALLERCVHCLVAKPMVPTLAQARVLVELQRAQGVYAAVEFHKRYDEANLFAKRAIGEGRIGRPLYASVEYSQRIDIPLQVFREWVPYTNVFQYLGVHYVDVLHFITGYMPVKATAIGVNGVLRGSGVDAFDSIHVTLEWVDPRREDARMVSRFDVGWVDPPRSTAMSDQRYTLVGSNGRIECDQKRRGVQLVQGDLGVSDINPYFSEFLPQGRDGAMRFQGYGFRSICTFLCDVLDYEAKRTTLERLEGARPTFAQALVSTAVIDAVNRALRRPYEWVSIDGLSG